MKNITQLPECPEERGYRTIGTHAQVGHTVKREDWIKASVGFRIGALRGLDDRGLWLDFDTYTVVKAG